MSFCCLLVRRPLSLRCQGLRGLPLDMSRIHLPFPYSAASSRWDAADALLRQEPDDEEDEEEDDEDRGGGEEDDDDDDNDTNDGYSE